MNKIKYELLDKIINDKELSKMEINVLIYLAKRCDDTGRLEGVYYKEIINAACVGTTQFYNVVKSLQSKGYITTSKDFNVDIDATLLNNSFIAETGEVDYRGYLNLNFSLFDSEKFYALRAGSKRLLLALIKKTVNDMARKNKEKFEPKIFISPCNLYKIYADKLHVSKRTVKSYFNEIKDFVSIHHDEVYTGKIIITIKADALKTPKVGITKSGKVELEKKVDRFDSDLSFISMLCRRNRIDSTEQSRIDAARLVSQFLNKANSIGQGIRSIMTRAIDNVKGVLNAKGLNKYIHDYIEKFKNNQTSFTPYKEPALATGTYNNNYKNSFNNFSQRTYNYDAVEKAWLQHHSIAKDCKSKNSFNNFQQRTYDYDAVEKRLLQKADNERHHYTDIEEWLHKKD